MMVSTGIQLVDWTRGADLERDLLSRGYSRQYRILDAYTILHLRTGQRVFPYSVVEISKQFASSQDNGVYLVTYIFNTRDQEKGYLIYPAGSTEAALCESFFRKCLVALKSSVC